MMEKIPNTNSQREILYHLKEEHRLRREAEIALERANRTSQRHQQMSKEYRSQIEKLNSLTHDFLCQRSKMEQVVIEKNNIKMRYEDKFRVMEQEINELRKKLQHKRVSVTDQRVVIFQEKIHCLEEENDLLHEKIWRMKRKYVDKSVSTEDFDGRGNMSSQVALSLNMMYDYNGKYSISSGENFGFSNNSEQYPRMQNENVSSVDSESHENSDNEVAELLNEWKHKSNVLAKQKQLLTNKLQQLEDDRKSETEYSALGKNFEYTNSSINFTPARTINSHDDEVFLPIYTSPAVYSDCSEQKTLTEITPFESKCAGIPKQNNFNVSWLARDSSRHCSSLDSILVPLNGRTIELLNSDDSYDPQIGLLNEQLYNLPDHKLIPAVRENLMHIRITKYGDEVLTQSAPGRISLIDFVRDGGYIGNLREETEAIDSFNFLKDFSDVSSEQGLYTSDGSN